MNAEQIEYVRRHLWTAIVFLAGIALAVVLVKFNVTIDSVCSNVKQRAAVSRTNTELNREFMRSAADFRAAAAEAERNPKARANDLSAARRYRQIAEALHTVPAPNC